LRLFVCTADADPEAERFGLVAGAIAFVGLCISSAVFFCLSEIADNTAEISKMLAEVTNRETQGSPALPKKGKNGS
jgi:hypothetical protein